MGFWHFIFAAHLPWHTLDKDPTNSMDKPFFICFSELFSCMDSIWWIRLWSASDPWKDRSSSRQNFVLRQEDREIKSTCGLASNNGVLFLSIIYKCICMQTDARGFSGRHISSWLRCILNYCNIKNQRHILCHKTPKRSWNVNSKNGDFRYITIFLCLHRTLLWKNSLSASERARAVGKSNGGHPTYLENAHTPSFACLQLIAFVHFQKIWTLV
jgi:hypothetical protein